MKKIFIWILTLIILSISVLAIDLCEQTILQNETCLMITPVLNCNNNVTVLNKQTNTTNNISMNLLQLDIYQFNFSGEEGEYQVILCDGSTREIEVKGDSMLINIAIIALLYLIGFAFVIIAELSKNHVYYIFGGAWFFGIAVFLRPYLMSISSYLNLAFMFGIGIIMFLQASNTAKKNKKYID